MDYKELTKEVQIPMIGLGVWQTEGQETIDAVTAALDAGYRLIDTAARYGNESEVGQAIAASSIPREEVFITSKLWKDDYGLEAAKKGFEESCQKLQVDYLDLYLLHWPIEDQELVFQSWQALEELYTEGKIRAIGVSNFNKEQLVALNQHATIKPMINQIEIHPTHAQLEVQKEMSDMGITLQAYSPLGHSEDLTHPLIEELAKKTGKTPAQVILRWEIQHGIIPVPKSVNPSRIKENLDVFDFTLSEEEMKQIDQIDDQNRLNKDPNAITFKNNN